MYQLQLTLIEHQEKNVLIRQRPGDGYVNATALCKASGKLLGHYLEIRPTQAFLKELSMSIALPIDLLIQTISTGQNELRGTWVHPQVAINLGQGCSPAFAQLAIAAYHD